MGDVILYGFPQSTYVRTARLALHEKGVAYDLDACRADDPAQAARHPFAKVPAFRHDDLVLFETMAIARYVDEAFDGPPLQPATAAGRARMTQWISAVVSYLYPSMIRNCVLERFAPVLFGRDTEEELVAASRPTIARHLDVLDGALATDAYLAGDGVTLADHFLLPILHYLRMTPEGEEMLPARGNLARWHAAMAARDAATATEPPLPRRPR